MMESHNFRRTQSAVDLEATQSSAFPRGLKRRDASVSNFPHLQSLAASSTSSMSSGFSSSASISPHLGSPQEGTLAEARTQRRFSSTFDQVEKMGEGAFGAVFSARNTTDSRRYAVKRIPFYFQAHEAFKIAKLKKLVLREAKVLAAFDHQNVVRYYQSWVETAGIVRRHPDEVQIENISFDRNGSPGGVTEREKSDDARKLGGGEGWDEEGNFEVEDEDDYLSELTTLMSFDGLNDGNNNFTTLTDDPNCSSSSNAVEDGKVLFLQLDLYVVMKLYNQSLKNILDMRKSEDEVSASENIQILKELLNALCYISSRGVVHRDISPCNIFFDSAGRAVLGDFGLAAADRRSGDKSGAPPLKPKSKAAANMHRANSGQESHDSRTGKVPKAITRMSTQAVLQQTLETVGEADSNESGDDSVGKPLYASPEQWNSNFVGVKADIFSLGVMWVEMHCYFKTGRERIEVLTRVRQGKLPQTFMHNYPHAAGIARRMLCQVPADRADSEELLLDPIFTSHTRPPQSILKEVEQLKSKVSQLTFQNVALRRLLREVCS